MYERDTSGPARRQRGGRGQRASPYSRKNDGMDVDEGSRYVTERASRLKNDSALAVRWLAIWISRLMIWLDRSRRSVGKAAGKFVSSAP